MQQRVAKILVRIAITIFLFDSSVFAQVSALKGDGVTDDTVALSNAILTACEKGGKVVLPPPSISYKVTRTLPTPGDKCQGVYISGDNVASRQQLDQQSFAPMVTIHMGTEFGGPVFDLTSYVTLENLDIEGYNQAVSIRDSVNVSLRNVCMSVSGTTGMRDNTPLKITNSFWIWFKGGCLMANGSGTTPILIMSGEQPTNGEAPVVGLITIEDLEAAGGGMKYIQRVAQSGTAGNLVFRNITIEDIQTDILSMTSENGAYYGEFEAITFDHVTTSDGTPVAVLSTHDPTLTVKGVFINQSTGQSNVKVRGQVVGYFDTAGVFDSMVGNTLTVGTLRFGTTQLGLSPSGALSVSVPVYQPPSNVQIRVAEDFAHRRQLGGLLLGTHSYMVVAVNGYNFEVYSAFAFSASSVTLNEPGSVFISWTPSPSNPVGYAVVRDNDQQVFYVPGASANHFVDMGGGGCCWGARPNTPTFITKAVVTQ